ncbi:protein FAM178B [Tenrec ecaudatus]|uniref:protein FAM178B n=1 Tax=Tenrec ecaudatus TaxID=94439 RepID=UPI003F59AF66
MSHLCKGSSSPWAKRGIKDHLAAQSRPGKVSVGLQPRKKGSSSLHAEVSYSPEKQWASSDQPSARSERLRSLRWYQIPLSSTRKPASGIFSRRFQASLQKYQQLRELKKMKVGRPFYCSAPSPQKGQPHKGASAPCDFLDHPLHRGHLHSTLCSPPLPPTHDSPKKPKVQPSGDMFPIDWSPPPVEFLYSKTPLVNQEAPKGVTKPQANPQPKKLVQKLPDLGPEEALTSLKALFWKMAGRSQQAASQEGDTHTSLTPGGSKTYTNTLEYLLQEKREQVLEQKWDSLLLQDFPNWDSVDLAEDNVTLTPEHRMLVEKYFVPQEALPQVHPGKTVFLPRSHPPPCSLDCSYLQPRSLLEGLFLSSPPAQRLSFLHTGLLSNLYLRRPDCPVPLLQWLFQLLTWPPETSLEAFGLLWDLSVDSLFKEDDEGTCVWCPTLQEILEVFHGLGAQASALPPPGSTLHEGRVLKGDTGLSWSEGQPTPWDVALDVSLSCICKFLTLCALAQPEAYTDGNLLGLIELLCQAGLDVRLRLVPKTDLQQLLLRLLENIREWPGKLQPLCSALSWLSDHHHNLLVLVQFFLDVTARSRQLRRQLSLLVIAQVLGQQETLPLWEEKAQLSSLVRLLSFMRLSSLQQRLHDRLGTSLPCQEQPPKAKASTELDHKVCYLCHSLLTLAGVVVSCQDITPDCWGDLQLLCMRLDQHISTRIRESPQAMHRTKLKDLATRIYVRWQELLSHCQPQVQYFSPWKDS